MNDKRINLHKIRRVLIGGIWHEVLPKSFRFDYPTFVTPNASGGAMLTGGAELYYFFDLPDYRSPQGERSGPAHQIQSIDYRKEETL